MLELWMKAQTEDEQTLGFLQNFFLLVAAVGFAFYGIEHWVIGHYLESFQSRIPFYISLVGCPLAVAMFFTTHKYVRIPFNIWMALTVLTGLLGALFHLLYNAGDAGVSVFTISGFIEAFSDPFRPVLAGLAHTHVGAVALIVGLSVRE